MAAAMTDMMTMTKTEAPAKKEGPKLWTGHNAPKAIGPGVRYSGPLENLPYPERPWTLEGAFERMYSDGFVIFPGVLKPDEVAALRAKIDASGKPDADYDVKGWCFNKHIGLDFRKDAKFLEYIDKANMAEVLDAILGGAVCAGGSLWVTGPGREMGIHLDHLPVPLPEDVLQDPRVRIPIFAATAHYYLNDMTPELGPTLVIPGSHRAGRPPADEASWHGITPKAAMVRAGDVVLFRSDIWHGAWKNSSAQRRYIMQVHYQSRRFYGSYGKARAVFKYSDEVQRTATARQKAMLPQCIY
jgi:hypothetical protein